MATPTPGKQPAVAATPPVSTPFSQSHLTAFSPHTTRNSVVPSPQQVRKSPATSHTIYGHPSNSSSFAGGAPINFDSPSVTSAVAAAAMGLGVGDMNMDLSLGMGRGEDEIKARLGQIQEILKVNKGRVTEEGLERLSRRVGLTFLWEEPMGEVTDKRILFAGESFSVEVDFLNDAVHSAKLEIFNANDSVTKWVQKAANVLLGDLEYAPGESPLTKMLDQFADNLERLTAFDKLSVLPMLNCYEAVAGIYESLKRLYDWEFTQLKQQNGAGKDDDWATRNVICTKSGRPLMHERKRIGLSVEYWQQKRLIPSKQQKKADSSKSWAMVIECTTAPNVSFSDPPEEPYPRVRVSDNWISQWIVKQNPTAEDLMNTAAHNALLDWVEPDLVMVPANDASKEDATMQGMPVDAGAPSKLPDIMFTAKFEPPICVSNYIMDVIYQVIRATRSLFPLIPNVTIDALILPHAADELNLSPSRSIERQKLVPFLDKTGTKTSRTHKNALFVQKLDPGYELRELPFSHPRHLIEIMPFLRQFAFLSTLLENSFGSQTDKVPATKNANGTKQQKGININKKNHLGANTKDEFLNFMQGLSVSNGNGTDDAKDNSKTQLNLDITLITEPSSFTGPKIEVVFPFRGRTGNVMFEIGLNGVVSVVSENILGGEVDVDAMDEGLGSVMSREELGRILEICEDLGVWVEFVRRKLGD